jgi:dihydrofolate reductase
VDFLFMPKNYSLGPFFKTIDTTIMGRKTYHVALRVSGGAYSNPGITSYVFSQTLAPGKREGVIFVNESPKSFVASLCKSKGKNIWHMGGGELARAFLVDDVIDELCLGVVSILLGEGLPLFPAGFPQLKYRLLENKSFSQGLITLKYERARSSHDLPAK